MHKIVLFYNTYLLIHKPPHYGFHIGIVTMLDSNLSNMESTDDKGPWKSPIQTKILLG